MTGDTGIAAVVLAAGRGSRLRPLTDLVPKALCPVGNVALIDPALERAETIGLDIAVNAHWLRDQVVAHVARRAHVSVEEPEMLGTAGALGKLRDWIGERDVLVQNADAWRPGSLASFVEGWDRERIRLLAVRDPSRGDFGPWRYAGAALLPGPVVRTLAPRPSGLYEVSWRRAWDEGGIEIVEHLGPFVDCGTPADYLSANLLASGGASVIGEGAVVRGHIERSVVWPGAVVEAGEHLVDVIRAPGGITVDGRASGIGGNRHG